MDDTLVDGNIVYSVILAAAISTDSTYNGLNPADFSFTNNDNDLPPPTKFYVVDDATTNRTFEYDAAGGAVERLFGTVFGNRIEAVACRTGVSVPRRFRFRRDGRTEEGDFANENHQADRERTPGSLRDQVFADLGLGLP